MTATITLLSTVFLLALTAVTSAQPTTSPDHPPLHLTYTKPAEKWEEALPLGNGRLGAMVFGHPTTERLQLNDATLYSGYPGFRDLPLDVRPDFPTVTRLLAEKKYPEAEEIIRTKWLGKPQACYQPLADLLLDFPHKGDVTDYRRTLDLTTATTHVSYKIGGTTYRRELFISHPDQALVVRLTADKPASITVRVRLTSDHPVTKSSDGDTHTLSGRAPYFVLRRTLKEVVDRKETWKYPELFDDAGNPRPGAKQIYYDDTKGTAFHTRVRAVATGGKTASTHAILSVENADAVTLLLTAATSFNGFDKDPAKDGIDPVAKSKDQLEAAGRSSFDALRANHIKDYQSLFNRVTLTLGPATAATSRPTDERLKNFAKSDDQPFVPLYFQFGRYLMISASRPGGQPMNLQGLWNDKIIPPWASSYTININTEMNYWPAEMVNLSECHEPLLQFIKELSVDGAKVAKSMYGRRGWVAHHNTEIWRQALPVDGYPNAAFWNMSPAWFSQHLFDHYAFTNDTDFLRTHAYPLMKGAAEFHLDWLVEDADGHLVTPVSTSPENYFMVDGKDGKKVRASVSPGATMDIAILRELFTNTLRAAEVLNVDPDFRDTLKKSLAKLRPYKVGSKGQLLEWTEEFPEQDPEHRHVSHLFALHPGTSITPDKTPDLAKAAQRTLEIRGDGGTGWSLAWKILFQARLHDGDHALKLINNLLHLTGDRSTQYSGYAGGSYPNLFCAHPPFQIDGNFGGTAAIAELLLQSQNPTDTGGYELHLLPALPTAWKSGQVTGLRARGNVTVDLTWSNGTLTSATLHPHSNTPLRLRYQSKTLDLTPTPNHPITLGPDLTQN